MTDEHIKIPNGHPAFMVLLKADSFPTHAIKALKSLLITALEASLPLAADLQEPLCTPRRNAAQSANNIATNAAARLTHELDLGTDVEWLSVGMPKPANLDQLNSAMTKAGYEPEEVSTPRFLARKVLRKLAMTVTHGQAGERRAERPTENIPELHPEDVSILQYLANQVGIAANTYDLAAAAGCDRKVVGQRLKRLREIGYVKIPDDRKRGSIITVAGAKRISRTSS